MQNFLAEYGIFIKWIGIVSSISFFLSLLVIPYALCRLNDDFFLHIHEPSVSKDAHPLVFILLRSARYFFGVLLLAAGILMIFLPGQGILTILLGASMLDFPGRKKAIDKILSYQSVQKSLNWIRKKAHKAPFSFAEEHL